MRRSLGKPFVAAVSVLAFAFAAGGAISEEAEFEDVQMDGSQIVAAGNASDDHAQKGLNTVPIDGLGPRNTLGPNNFLVRQMMAARPNEDLVICVAGCFSDRDRVVYAQPMDRAGGATKPATFSGRSSSNDPVKPVEKKAAHAEAASDTGASVSHNPHSPTILNGASDGTGGSASND